MARYDNKVLNRLIDTYENSLLSIGENKRTMHIEMQFTKKTFPEYFDESSVEYENIHIMMKALEDKGFLSIVWKDDKKDYLIRKVRLELSALEQIYTYLKRTPKNGLENQTVEMLKSYQDENCKNDQVPITKAFVLFLLDRIQNHQSVKEYIDIARQEESRKLLAALGFVESNTEGCYIREFSIAHFQDSKYFEHVKAKVVKILRNFSDAYEGMEEEEILAEYGIYHTPNYVYFKGNAELAIADEKMNLSALRQGLGISGEDLDDVVFSDIAKIKQIITIENLTTFFRWQEPESLIIYLGGYHNGVRRALLGKIHRMLPQASYHHFGDIDAGGFAILKDLRARTGIPFESYHMDLETLKQYEKYGKELTTSDRKRLEALAEEDEWKEVASYMLEHNVKLEQECIMPK